MTILPGTAAPVSFSNPPKVPLKEYLTALPIYAQAGSFYFFMSRHLAIRLHFALGWGVTGRANHHRRTILVMLSGQGLAFHGKKITFEVILQAAQIQVDACLPALYRNEGGGDYLRCFVQGICFEINCPLGRFRPQGSDESFGLV